MAPSADYNYDLNASPIRPETPSQDGGSDSSLENNVSDSTAGAQQPETPPNANADGPQPNNLFELPANTTARPQPGMQGGLAATLSSPLRVPQQRAARRPRRNALVAPSAPPPPPRPYQDVETPEFRSPWPRQPPHVPGGRPDVSRRCPHDLVYPCFCRNITDVPGFICLTCRFPLCAYNELLQRGTSQELQLELDREVARDRNAYQFQQEIRWCLEAARQREQRYHGTGPGPYSNGN